MLRGALPGALSGVEGPFDLVFADPPYDADAREAILERAAPLLRPDGLFVYEHRSRYNPPERPPGLQRSDRRVYGDTAVAFYAVTEGE